MGKEVEEEGQSLSQFVTKILKKNIVNIHKSTAGAVIIIMTIIEIIKHLYDAQCDQSH